MISLKKNLATTSTTVLQLVGNLSNSPNVSIVKDQCNLRVMWCLDHVFLRIRKCWLDIQCSQLVNAIFEVSFWPERHVSGSSFQVLVTGLQLQLFSSDSAFVFIMGKISEVGNQFKCQRRAQSRLGKILVLTWRSIALSVEQLPEATHSCDFSWHWVSRPWMVPWLGAVTRAVTVDTINPISQFIEEQLLNNWAPANQATSWTEIKSMNQVGTVLVSGKNSDLHLWDPGGLIPPAWYFQQLEEFISRTRIVSVGTSGQPSVGEKSIILMTRFSLCPAPALLEALMGFIMRCGIACYISMYLVHEAILEGPSMIKHTCFATGDELLIITCFLSLATTILPCTEIEVEQGQVHEGVEKWWTFIQYVQPVHAIMQASLVYVNSVLGISVQVNATCLVQHLSPGGFATRFDGADLQECSTTEAEAIAFLEMLLSGRKFQLATLYRVPTSKYTAMNYSAAAASVQEREAYSIECNITLVAMVDTELMQWKIPWFQFCPTGTPFFYGYGSEQFQWEIAWPLKGECSEIAGMNLTGLLLPNIGAEIFEANFIVVSYWVGRVAAWYVCCPSFRITWACFPLDNMTHNNRLKSVQTLIRALPEGLVVSGVELQSQASTSQFMELLKGCKQDNNLCEPSVSLLSVLLPTQKVELAWDPGIWKLLGLPNRNYKHVEAKGGRTVSSTQFQWEFSTGCGQALYQGGRSIMVLHAFVVHHYHLDGFLNRVIGYYLDGAYFFDLAQVCFDNVHHHDYSATKEHRVPWDPGGKGQRRLEGKPSFKEGGLSATWPRLPLVGAWALGNGLGPTHSSTYLQQQEGNEQVILEKDQTGGWLFPHSPYSVLLPLPSLSL